MRNISTKNMSRAEWLAVRYKYVGGSDVAAIMGLSKWLTPLDVYLRVIADAPPADNPNDHMEAGIRLEDTIAKWYADSTGKKIQRDNKMRIDSVMPFFVADIDRLVMDKWNNGILECKNIFRDMDDWDTAVPPYYKSQMQAYLYITGLAWGDFAVLFGGWNLKKFTMERDADFMLTMTQALQSFWFDHVEKRIPPPPINPADVQKLFPTAVPLKEADLKDNPDAYGALLGLYGARESQAALKKTAVGYETTVKQYIGDAELLRMGDDVVATWKTLPASRFQLEAFKRDHPQLARKYTESNASRRFILKDKNIERTLNDPRENQL